MKCSINHVGDTIRDVLLTELRRIKLQKQLTKFMHDFRLGLIDFCAKL